MGKKHFTESQIAFAPRQAGGLLDVVDEPLGRRVRRQAVDLAASMQHRQQSAVEFEATLRERNRLAGNHHDTVLQTVTGIGYQVAACRAEAGRVARGGQGHFGLDGMRARVERIGGTLEIRSSPGSGTTVTVRLPLG